MKNLKNNDVDEVNNRSAEIINDINNTNNMNDELYE